jgi:hypothetical protein
MSDAFEIRTVNLQNLNQFIAGNSKILGQLIKIRPAFVSAPIPFFHVIYFLFFPSCRSMALGLTRSQTEMSIRNLPGGGGKVRPARKSQNFTAIF